MTVLHYQRRLGSATTVTRAIRPHVPNMAPLIHTPLSQPAVHCGAVDATGDRIKATPRTMSEAFGPAARPVLTATGPARTPLGHRVATWVSVAAGLYVVAMLIAERI